MCTNVFGEELWGKEKKKEKISKKMTPSAQFAL